MTHNTLSAGFLQNKALIIKLERESKKTLDPTLLMTYNAQIKALQKLNEAITEVLWKVYDDPNVEF